MKRAIFLLVLFAFQTVFADQFEEDLNNLHNSSINHRDGIVKGLRSDIETSIRDAQKKGINQRLSECWKEFHAFEEFHQAGCNKYDECYNRATEEKSLDLAEKCYRFNNAALEHQAKLCLSNTQKCIKRYVKEAYVLRGRSNRKVQL